MPHLMNRTQSHRKTRPPRREHRCQLALGVREISDEDVDAIADRVAQLLGQRPPESKLLDASEVAQRYRVSRGWVYEHARELGAITLGGGSKPRLRFDAARVAEALAMPAEPARASQRREPRRKRRRGDGGEQLLPIEERGSNARSSSRSRSLRRRSR